MPAKQRTIARTLAVQALSPYPNLLVSGCSYTWNSSETHAVAWPYYLRDLAGFQQVFDCSQRGSGYNHTHIAVINELETNSQLTPESTLVIVMWSGNERVDITADQSLIATWTKLESQDLGQGLGTLSLLNQPTARPNRPGDQFNSAVESLRVLYRTLISGPGQVLESSVKLIGLAGYLKSRGFDYVFLDWDDTLPRIVAPGIDPVVQGLFAPIETLGSWATRTDQRIPNDGHPTVHAHLGWTQEQLIPYLLANNLVDPVAV